MGHCKMSPAFSIMAPNCGGQRLSSFMDDKESFGVLFFIIINGIKRETIATTFLRHNQNKKLDLS